jgi:hypothetical protein
MNPPNAFHLNLWSSKHVSEAISLRISLPQQNHQKFKAQKTHSQTFSRNFLIHRRYNCLESSCTRLFWVEFHHFPSHCHDTAKSALLETNFNWKNFTNFPTTLPKVASWWSILSPFFCYHRIDFSTFCWVLPNAKFILFELENGALHVLEKLNLSTRNFNLTLKTAKWGLISTHMRAIKTRESSGENWKCSEMYI